MSENKSHTDETRVGWKQDGATYVQHRDSTPEMCLAYTLIQFTVAEPDIMRRLMTWIAETGVEAPVKNALEAYMDYIEDTAPVTAH